MLVSFSAQTCLHRTWWFLIYKFLRVHCDWEKVRVDTLKDAVHFCNLSAVLKCTDTNPSKSRFYWIVFYKQEKNRYFVHAIGKRCKRHNDLKIVKEWAELKHLKNALIFVNKRVVDTELLLARTEKSENKQDILRNRDR